MKTTEQEKDLLKIQSLLDNLPIGDYYTPLCPLCAGDAEINHEYDQTIKKDLFNISCKTCSFQSAKKETPEDAFHLWIRRPAALYLWLQFPRAIYRLFFGQMPHKQVRSCPLCGFVNCMLETFEMSVRDLPISAANELRDFPFFSSMVSAYCPKCGCNVGMFDEFSLLCLWNIRRNSENDSLAIFKATQRLKFKDK